MISGILRNWNILQETKVLFASVLDLIFFLVEDEKQFKQKFFMINNYDA